MDSTLPSIGESLGDYRLGAVLGSGGQGTVYQAERAGQGGIGTQLAIKILPAIPGDQDTQERRYRDFLHEAYLLTRMHHPHIVTIFEVTRLAGFPCIVMELVEGEGLDRLIKRRRAKGEPPKAAWCLKVISQAAEALRYAHDLLDRDGSPLRVIHRDIKPANMLMGPGGSLKLTDFGLARSDHGERDETQVGILKGSVKYMSPEQARCEDLGITTDFFSLGVVLYEMLTLESPFGLPPDAGASAYLISIQQGAREVAQRVGWLSEWCPPIGALIGGMLAYDPAQRFQSADALISALEAAQRRVDADLAWSPLPLDDGTYIGDDTGEMPLGSPSPGMAQASSFTAGASAPASSSASASGSLAPGAAMSATGSLGPRGAISSAAGPSPSPSPTPITPTSAPLPTAVSASGASSIPAQHPHPSHPSPWLMLLGGVLLGGALLGGGSVAVNSLLGGGGPTPELALHSVSIVPSPTPTKAQLTPKNTPTPTPAPQLQLGAGTPTPKVVRVIERRPVPLVPPQVKVAKAAPVSMSFNGMPAVLLEVNGVERGEAGPFSRITLELAPGPVSLKAKDVATGELVWSRTIQGEAGSRWRCHWRGGDRWVWRQGRAVVESMSCDLDK